MPSGLYQWRLILATKTNSKHFDGMYFWNKKSCHYVLTKNSTLSKRLTSLTILCTVTPFNETMVRKRQNLNSFVHLIHCYNYLDRITLMNFIDVSNYLKVHFINEWIYWNDQYAIAVFYLPSSYSIIIIACNHFNLEYLWSFFSLPPFMVI